MDKQMNEENGHAVMFMQFPLLGHAHYEITKMCMSYQEKH